MLSSLERFSEARLELEDCLLFFQNNPELSAKVRISLATLFALQGDFAQAITQERRALCTPFSDPAVRAVTHNNIALNLKHLPTPSALAESPRHQLAALLYSLAAGLGQNLQNYLQNFASDFRSAHIAGTVPAVPRVATLLADPAFAPLEQWLRQRQVDLDQLQAAVDQILDQVRQATLASE